LHFVGDPSHLKEKNGELLSNLRCKKLSDFQWYKNTFLTRVMLREDSNQPFWKEKFLTGLPILLGEKVRNKIKDTFTTKTIPYDQLTYGELVSFTQKEGLKICQDLKLQQQLKWEMKRTTQELGSFYHQFDLSTKKPSCSGTFHSPKNIRTTSLFINDRPINTDNNFIPNQINLITKSPTNSTNPTDLSSQNPN
jgi:hypothetical protein